MKKMKTFFSNLWGMVVLLGFILMTLAILLYAISGILVFSIVLGMMSFLFLLVFLFKKIC